MKCLKTNQTQAFLRTYAHCDKETIDSELYFDYN